MKTKVSKKRRMLIFREFFELKSLFWNLFSSDQVNGASNGDVLSGLRGRGRFRGRVDRAQRFGAVRRLFRCARVAAWRILKNQLLTIWIFYKWKLLFNDNSIGERCSCYLTLVFFFVCFLFFIFAYLKPTRYYSRCTFSFLSLFFLLLFGFFYTSNKKKALV